MEENDGRPVIPFESAAAWEAWLEENHSSSRGVWVKIAKKASGLPTVTHPEALDVALCFGWIDGQRNSLDETWFLQKFTPRTARSKWSKINREKVAELTAAGRMRPAGQAAIDHAKKIGTWEHAYDSPRNMPVPEDLKAALDACPPAAEFFSGLNSRNRFAILYRIADAKRPETRSRRIADFVDRMERRETIY